MNNFFTDFCSLGIAPANNELELIEFPQSSPTYISKISCLRFVVDFWSQNWPRKTKNIWICFNNKSTSFFCWSFCCWELMIFFGYFWFWEKKKTVRTFFVGSELVIVLCFIIFSTLLCLNKNKNKLKYPLEHFQPHPTTIYLLRSSSLKNMFGEPVLFF